MRRLPHLVTAVVTSVALLLTSGCTIESPKTYPAKTWAALAAKLVEDAGSDQITEARLYMSGQVRLRVRVESGDRWRTKDSLRSTINQETEQLIDFTTADTIAVGDIDWERLATLAKQVPDCDNEKWLGAGFKILPGGRVLDYGLCTKGYHHGTASIDGEPRPDRFDFSTAEGIDEGLAWARELAPEGKALVYYTQGSTTTIEGLVIDRPPSHEGATPCVATLRFEEYFVPDADNGLLDCGGNRIHQEELATSFDLNRITGEIIHELRTSLMAEAPWRRHSSELFEIYAIDADTIEAKLTNTNATPAASVTTRVALPAA